MRIAELSRTGYFCPDGGPVYTEEGLGATAAAIHADVAFEYGGRRAVVKTMVDHGAQNIFAFIDTSVAEKLGIPLTTLNTKAGYSGVGGASQSGWTATMDRISMVKAPTCQMAKVPVLIGKLGMNVDALLGDQFIEQLELDSQYRNGQWLVGCKQSPLIAVASVFPTELMLFGILAVAGVALVVLFKKDIF